MPMTSHALLSVRQPWAWAIAHGYKPVENRTWGSHYTGALLIHAGKRELPEDVDYVCALVAKHLRIEPAEVVDRYMTERYFGGVVGEAQMVGCSISVGTAAHTLRVPVERVAPWFEGPYGFLLARARPLVTPIPLSGRLGIWRQRIDDAALTFPDA